MNAENMGATWWGSGSRWKSTYCKRVVVEIVAQAAAESMTMTAVVNERLKEKEKPNYK